jgi:hypothetical protein
MDKRLEIKNHIIELWDDYSKWDLIFKIEKDYIFWPLWENEHYNPLYFIEIYDEVYLEKNPLPESVVDLDEEFLESN